MKSKIKDSSNSLSLSILVSLLLSSFALVYFKKTLFYVTYFHKYIPYGDLYFFILCICSTTFLSIHISVNKTINFFMKIIFFIFIIFYIFYLYKFGAFDPIFIDNAYIEHGSRSSFYSNPYLILVSIVLAYLTIKYKCEEFKINYFFKYLSIIFLLITSYFLVIDDYSFYNQHSLNFSVTILPIINNFFGAFPPIDSQSQYGYYNYFFYPILKLIGISITKITLIFSLLFFLCFFSIFYHAKKLSGNYFLSFSVLVSSFFLNTNIAAWWPGREFYFQYRPIRMIAPCILIFSIFHYFANPNTLKRIFYTSVFSCLCIWNIDSGLPTLATFLLADYINYIYKNSKQSYKNKIIYLARLTFESAFIISSILFIFQFYLYINTNKFAGFNLFFEPHLTWATGKHYFHYWSFGSENAKAQFNMFSTLIYSLAICISIYYMRNKNYDIKYLSLFITAIIGFSISTYGSYQSMPAIMSAYLLPLIFLNLYSINDFNNLSKTILISPLILLTLIFFLQIKNNKDFQDYATYFEIKFPTKSNNRYLWNYYGYNESEKKEYMSSIMKVKDLLIKPTIEPSWVKKSKILDSFNEINCETNNLSILILSMHDYYLHLKTKCKSGYRGINVPHYEVYRQWDNLFFQLKMKSFDYIVIDDTNLIRSFDKKNYDHFKNLVNDLYKLKINKVVGYDWDYSEDEWKKNNFLIYKK